MLLTTHEVYLLEILKTVKYIRRDQLAQLMKRRYKLSEYQTDREIYRLRYLGKLWLDEESGDAVRLPNRKRDEGMLAAIDVLLKVCGGFSPELTAAVPPCKLSFFMKDDRGYLDFKIVPVTRGEEQPILEKLQAQNLGFVCTFLFLIEDGTQIERLATSNKAYYAIPTDEGGYTFFKKKAGG